MNKIIRAALVVLALTCIRIEAATQNATQAAFIQKDTSEFNPNAARDLQVVRDYVQALVAGDLQRVRSLVIDDPVGLRNLLASNFQLRHTQATEPAAIEKEITDWLQQYKAVTDRKLLYYHTQTLRIISGSIQGSWVYVWSAFGATLKGKEIIVPFHGAYKLNAEGKIINVFAYWDRKAIN